MSRFRWLVGVLVLVLVPALAWARHPRGDADPPPSETIGAPSPSNKAVPQFPRSVIPGGRATLPTQPLIVVPYSHAYQEQQYSPTLFGRIGAWLIGGLGFSVPMCNDERPPRFSVCVAPHRADASCGACLATNAGEGQAKSSFCAAPRIAGTPCVANSTVNPPSNNLWASWFTMLCFSRTRGWTSDHSCAKPLCTNARCDSRSAPPTARALDNSYRKGPSPQPAANSYLNNLPSSLPGDRPASAPGSPPAPTPGTNPSEPLPPPAPIVPK
jgi:hypothetical protein